MTDWQLVFLGVMAAALVVMAVTQLLVTLALLRTAKQVTSSIQELQRDVRPLIDKANRITDDAARATALAVAQVERLDRLVSNVAGGVGVVQGLLDGRVRQGAAFVAAFRAVIAAIREWQDRGSAPREDEDPLFVG